MNQANLSYSDLKFINFKEANLIQTNLSHTDLSGADLTFADLSEANLSKAYLFKITFNVFDWFELLENQKVKGVETLQRVETLKGKYVVKKDLSFVSNYWLLPTN